MEENKIYQIHTKIAAEEKTEYNSVPQPAAGSSLLSGCPPDKSLFGAFHSNPIIQKMLVFNMNNKKDKFKFKDLFR